VRLDRSGQVRLTIYSILGSEVKTLQDGFRQAGTIQYTWDGTDRDNHKVPSGVYFYKLLTDRGSEVRRMVLLK
jgi:flagellar hook assembly protein FlgD